MNMNMSPHYEPDDDDETEGYYNMPIKKGKSKAVIQNNVKTGMASEKSQKKSAAIAMSEVRKLNKNKKGK